MNGLCVHPLRATALSHEATIAKLQEWPGHANVSTTRLYNWRKNAPRGRPLGGYSRLGQVLTLDLVLFTKK